ncbi:hypothetical protein LR48_Vigan588s001300 [Vigna angularis]|uniref:Uncharacterized protein n=1 Tax=Phaseolus angularis TaxID=3914 RepID=A0A0L9TDW2_PHAAN|nr:hypothetical protein LR48_Vigan588s001300 [Vigna angularis]
MIVNYNDVLEYELDISGTVHAEIEEDGVSGESRGRSLSIVLEFRHRLVRGFTLRSVEEGQLNYASAKMTNSSTIIQIRMSRVEYILHGLKDVVEEIPLEQVLEDADIAV